MPGRLKRPDRLNWTVSPSIQVRLVAWTGDDGLTAEPERTRSVALMLLGLTFPEKVSVIDVGDVAVTSVAPLARRVPRRRVRARW